MVENQESLIKKIMSMEGVQGVTIQDNGNILIYTDGTHNYEEVDGVKVHSLRSDKIKTYELARIQESHLDVTKKVWRPVPGGVSGANLYNTAGTIGMKVYKDGIPYLLSNTHIFGNRAGVPVTQPSPLDGGNISDTVATTSDFTRIFRDQVNEVDAALAVPSVDLADNILNLGVPHGVEEPQLLMKVRKSGRNGVTSGVILGREGTFKVEYPTDEDKIETVLFKGVFVTNNMAKPGDSGSVLLHGSNVVGLLFAGSSFITIYIPFHKVVQRLGIEVDRI